MIECTENSIKSYNNDKIKKRNNSSNNNNNCNNGENNINNEQSLKNINSNENNKNNNDDETELLNNITTTSSSLSTKKPIVLKKKRHPLITTLRYVAMFFIFFLLTNEYLVQFVHVEAVPLNKGKFSHINSNVLDPKDYNSFRIEYSTNYHEITSDHLFNMLNNRSRDIPLSSSNDFSNNNTNNNNNNDDENIINSSTDKINNKLTSEEIEKEIKEKNLKVFRDYNLTEDYYTTILNSNTTYILFLYHMDCPFSHRLLPIVETLSRTYPNILFFQSRGFTVILKSHFHTRTTPTLFIRVNDTLVKYKGRKDLVSIKKWISSNSNQIPIEVEPNVDIELSKEIRVDRGYLLYFSCVYVFFLVFCAIKRWFKKYQKMKTD